MEKRGCHQRQQSAAAVMTTSRANAADALPKFWFPHSPEGYAVGEVLQHDSEGDRMQVKLHVSASEVKVTRAARETAE